MAYAVEANIERALPHIDFTTTSPITTSDITVVIAEVEASLNVQVAGWGFTTPLTTPADAVAVLKNASIYFTCVRVLRGLGKQLDLADKFEEMGKAEMALLEANKDVMLGGGEDDGPEASAAARASARVFKKDSRQW